MIYEIETLGSFTAKSLSYKIITIWNFALNKIINNEKLVCTTFKSFR